MILSTLLQNYYEIQSILHSQVGKLGTDFHPIFCSLLGNLRCLPYFMGQDDYILI